MAAVRSVDQVIESVHLLSLTFATSVSFAEPDLLFFSLFLVPNVFLFMLLVSCCLSSVFLFSMRLRVVLQALLREGARGLTLE